MSQYTVTATREGKWWVLDVDGVGVTQARSLGAAAEWVRDLIRTMTGDDDPQFEISTRVRGADVEAAKAAQRRIEDAERDLREAAGVVRAVVRDLGAAGVSQQDTAAILNVSRQRVQQLSHG